MEVNSQATGDETRENTYIHIHTNTLSHTHTLAHTHTCSLSHTHMHTHLGDRNNDQEKGSEHPHVSSLEKYMRTSQSVGGGLLARQRMIEKRSPHGSWERDTHPAFEVAILDMGPEGLRATRALRAACAHDRDAELLKMQARVTGLVD